ncbi:MAG: site-specific DNA-methyltransferase, partial [Lachnospiraceae bacterium]|nr:site-specific DNA-methyltransferase [Lachnospiraceae bacterium]
YFYPYFKKLGLFLRNRIIWHFGHGLHCSKRFSGRYETILWFTKSDEYTFNLDDVRIPSKYPGKRYFKGEKRGQISGNPKGKNPEDVWEMTLERLVDDWDAQIWEIPNVKNNHPEKVAHPCQFPVELVERCVLALTNEGDIVYDPFAGVGSSLIAALKNNREAYGSELEQSYVDIGLERIEKLSEDALKTRPIYKKIWVPSPNDKVAQIPEEWSKVT